MFELRKPQVDILNKASIAIKSGHNRILIMGATGLGKTILAREMIDSSLKHGKKVLMTVHRINLVDQTFEKMKDFNPSICQGQDKRFDPSKPFQIATLQTLMNREIENPDLILIDEVHYGYNSKLVQQLFERFPKARVIGLSATPVNEQGYLLEDFDYIIDDYDTGRLIKLGWLVPFDCYTHITPDLSEVKMSGHDYQTESLSEVMNQPHLIKSVIDGYLKFGENKKFIVFAVNKQHCRDLKEAFDKENIPVEYVTADTPDTERKRIYSAHRNGIIKGLINIEILTTGYDDPSLMVGILAAPTKAWRKYIQACGRIIRLLGNSYEESVKNGKSKAILIDCAGALEEHDLPHVKKKLEFKAKISKVIDRQLNIDESENASDRKKIEIEPEKLLWLKKIGSLLDLYEGKEYRKESDLQSDVNNFLGKTGWLEWRQNSGKANIDGRWVNFTSKSGLPDCTLFYDESPIYIGIELKLPKGVLTPHQKKTLPEMIQKKALLFFAESVRDVYDIIQHVENNVKKLPQGMFIYNSIYQLDDRQKYFRNKFKL